MVDIDMFSLKGLNFAILYLIPHSNLPPLKLYLIAQ